MPSFLFPRTPAEALVEREADTLVGRLEFDEDRSEDDQEI
jgi:hypothetical protein